MFYIEDVFNAYKVTRRNKRKSPDAVEFELHWQQYCAEIFDEVNNRTFQPTAYTFVTKRPKPREVFAADFKTRVLHHYLDIRLRPLLEARMGSHTYNNRIGMGQTACQKAVMQDIFELSEGYTKDCFIVKLDIKGCFPNIVQDIAFKQLKNVIIEDYHGYDKEELLYILSVCIFSYPTLHCYRKSDAKDWIEYIDPDKSLFNKPLGIGAGIGHLPWQNAVNYYFHEIDEWAAKNRYLYERYVDDMYFVVKDKESFIRRIPEIRAMLAKLGARLNEKKFYCQHYSKCCECLGTHIKKGRLYPNNRIIHNAIIKAKSFSACVREDMVETLISSMNSYMGICKNGNGFWQAWKIILHLDPRWWKYVVFDWRNVKLVAKDEFTHKELIKRRYDIFDEKDFKRFHLKMYEKMHHETVINYEIK